MPPVGAAGERRRESHVKLSQDRILTTHVGSLPRSAAIVELLYKKENGEAVDAAAYDAAVTAGVADAVAKQIAAGIDVVSDGEIGKVGYATYVKDRLSGFAGHYPRPPHLDLAPYPELREALKRMLGKQAFKRAACIGPIALVDRAAGVKDIANLHAATAARRPVEAFMNAASPGVVSAFQSNKHYASHEAYVDAIAAAMKPEYDAIVAAGFILQLDCPDLAMARHTGFQELSEAEFLKRAVIQVEALNHAVRDIPADRMRLHVCWGN
jgi:5-methyltetrahydropteroyltriglutamate--homocysteine methyltransferase